MLQILSYLKSVVSKINADKQSFSSVLFSLSHSCFPPCYSTAPQSRRWRRESAITSAIEAWCKMTLPAVSGTSTITPVFFSPSLRKGHLIQRGYINRLKFCRAASAHTLPATWQFCLFVLCFESPHCSSPPVSEEQCLYQIYLDELYGGLQKPNEEEKKKYVCFMK